MNSTEHFESTKLLNNITRNDYSVQDYRLNKNESELVKKLLEKHISDLEFDDLEIAKI